MTEARRHGEFEMKVLPIAGFLTPCSRDEEGATLRGVEIKAG